MKTAHMLAALALAAATISGAAEERSAPPAAVKPVLTKALPGRTMSTHSHGHIGARRMRADWLRALQAIHLRLSGDASKHAMSLIRHTRVPVVYGFSSASGRASHVWL